MGTTVPTIPWVVELEGRRHDGRLAPGSADLAQGALDNRIHVLAAASASASNASLKTMPSRISSGDADAASGGRLGELGGEIVGKSDADRADVRDVTAVRRTC